MIKRVKFILPFVNTKVSLYVRATKNRAKDVWEDYKEELFKSTKKPLGVYIVEVPDTYVKRIAELAQMDYLNSIYKDEVKYVINRDMPHQQDEVEFYYKKISLFRVKMIICLASDKKQEVLSSLGYKQYFYHMDESDALDYLIKHSIEPENYKENSWL